MLQQSMVSLSMMMQQGLCQFLWKSFVAGYTAATKLIPGDASEYEFSNAMSSYTAQNIGADKPERVTAGYRASVNGIDLFSDHHGSNFLIWSKFVGTLLKCGAEGSAMGYGMSL